MADPLSIAASAIAIAGLAAKVSKAIYAVRQSGELPGRLYALKNEAADLEVVLRQIAFVIEEPRKVQYIDQAALQDILGRANAKLSEVSQTLERVTEFCLKGNVRIVKRAAIWWKEKQGLQIVQDDLRSIRSTLNLMLGATHSHDLNHVQLELHQVSMVTKDSWKMAEMHRDTISYALDQYYDGISTDLQERDKTLQERLERLEKLFLRQGILEEAVQYDQSGALPPYTPLAPTPVSSGPARSGSSTKGRHPAVEGVSIQALQYTGQACYQWCPCACHSKLKPRLPNLTSKILGRLFVGYSGVPILNKKCDFQRCRRRRATTVAVEYWFPLWFLAMNVQLQLRHEASTGPQLQLATVRRVPDTAPSITFALQGNIDGLKSLFSQGLASPRDVSESRGYSILRWALWTWQYDTVKFLVAAGAPLDDISVENVWDLTFRGKISPENQDELRCITSGSDWIDDQDFPLVHQILLGFSSKSLEAELKENLASIYQVDIQQRTALSWAAARGQEREIALLISYGANPNSVDVTGRYVIHRAVDSGRTAAVRLVLEAGAVPDPIIPQGLLRSPPILGTVMNSVDTSMLKTILDFGAKVESCGPERITALHLVAQYRTPDYARLLLEHGADINALNKDGKTPVIMAIMYHNHSVLQVFLDSWFQYSTHRYLQAPNLLQTIAEYGDTETIATFSRARFARIQFEEDSIAPALETLKQRRDKTEGLEEEFARMAVLLRTDPLERITDEELVETGVLASGASSWHSLDFIGPTVAHSFSDEEVEFFDAEESFL